MMKSAPPSPNTSDEFANEPIGMIVHPDDSKKRGTEHVHFRFIPTRSCVVMGVAILIVLLAMGLSMFLIITDAGDTTWAYGMLGSVVGVGLIYLKPASNKKLTSPV